MNTPLNEQDSWMKEMAKYGIVDPEVLLQAASAEEALALIADRFRELNTIQQFHAGRAIGFDDATIRLLAKGRAGLNAYINEAKALGIITQEQTAIAAAFKTSQTDLDRALRDMSHTFSGPVTEALTEATKAFTEWYKINREWITSGIDTVSQAVADNLGAIAAAVGLITGATVLASLAKLAELLGKAKAAAALGGAGGLLMRAPLLGLSAWGGWEAGKWLNENVVDPGVKRLQGDPNATLGGVIYDWLNPPTPEPEPFVSAGGPRTRVRVGRAGAMGGDRSGTTYNDNRQVEINVNGGDIEQVRRVIREEVGEMAEQSTLDFSSAVAN